MMNMLKCTLNVNNCMALAVHGLDLNQTLGMGCSMNKIVLPV